MMKRMLISALCASAVLSAHAAEVAGGSSNTQFVIPGPSVLMATDLAGIAMPVLNNNNEPDTTKIVSFERGPIFQANTQIAPNGATTGHGYIEIEKQNKMVKMSEAWKHTITSGIGQGTEVYAYRQLQDALPNFPQFGGQVIGKVTGIPANADGTVVNVYFGEWAPMVANPDQGFNPDLNMNHPNRTAWYVGETPTTSMPTLSNVTYDVVGVKKYNPSTPSDQTRLFAGTLTASYGNGNNSISGTLGGVNFAGTSIDSNGSFSNESTIEGRFYGDQAQAIGGLYKNGTDSFGFGGKKAAN